MIEMLLPCRGSAPVPAPAPTRIPQHRHQDSRDFRQHSQQQHHPLDKLKSGIMWGEFAHIRTFNTFPHQSYSLGMCDAFHAES